MRLTPDGADALPLAAHPCRYLDTSSSGWRGLVTRLNSRYASADVSGARPH